MESVFNNSIEAFPQFASIKVVGVGGGGCNAVNRMIEKGLRGVEFVALNTDVQALKRSRAALRVQIGVELARGLGAGGNPEVGRKAALEAESVVLDVLQGADMLFITAGMGGGTGTGAAPVVARLARSLGILTIGIVSLPFAFEGKRRSEHAQAGLAILKDQVDTLITIPNDRLLQMVDRRASLQNAFSLADDVLHQGIQAISELITVPGLINLDFADARTIMQTGGAALMSVGCGKGEQRAHMAAEQAISNPLLDVTIHGAQGILLNVTGGPDMSLHEVSDAASMIREIAHPDANVIFGAVIDPAMEDEMRIAMIATGFLLQSELPMATTRAQAGRPEAAAGSQPVPQAGRPETAAACQPVLKPGHPETATSLASAYQEALPSAISGAPDFTARILNTDDLDVPTFMRKRQRTI